jgi:hypothetical protein
MLLYSATLCLSRNQEGTLTIGDAGERHRAHPVANRKAANFEVALLLFCVKSW